MSDRDYLRKDLRAWHAYMAESPIDESYIVQVLAARSAAHDQGMQYESEPWLRELDAMLLDRAQEVLEATDLLDQHGHRVAPSEHWWWFLDEIQDGRRPRPEVG